ncbi:MAG TPA: heme o synthase [Candidatus Acidoferrum sp.]|jgi:protoheme IX farnesyltransferase|nr:heme o synthase [Candidatus Acidoferrum sp.]
MAVEAQVPAAARGGLGAGALRVVADYVGLLKPRIILLLLVTELGAMMVAARGWPGTWVTLGSLAGGALAAGGAGAVNCWFDRDIDAVMPRTRRRPIAAGRITPASGLAFGIIVGLGGVALVGLASNVLAAALAAAGGLVYVFVYTMWLKRMTPQNIVIGGAAGAFPPLVGWAAVTGSLSPLAWVLFAIIFFWTPPHFWALALVLRKQYAAAKVPMLPVVVGGGRTRRAIVAYTIPMVGVSLLPWIWLGPVYGLSAIILGGVFLALAWRASRTETGHAAVTLFHYSLVYLALLFIAAPIAAAILAFGG